MSEKTEDLSESKPSLEERKLEAEIRLREAEIQLKRDELVAQIERDKKTKWSPAAAIAVIVALMGFLAAVAGNLMQNHANLNLEKQRLQSNLILGAIETGNTEEAQKNLQFLIKAGLLQDETGAISAALYEPEAVPVLPAPAGMNKPVILQQRLYRAINELAKAKNQKERFYALCDAGKESFIAGNIEDARRYAQELMTLLPLFQGNWNYGNAVQDANIVLGRIAVTEGHIDDAKGHLLKAGKSPGSPQMNSFGPNMSLAKDLLEKGERDVVLEYFELCRKFWKRHRGRLDEWSRDVEAGKIPNFGANLLY